jgi:hypothetical protein
MTTLQILAIAFWIIVYLLLSILSLMDALNGEFKFKNGVPNVIAAIWVAVTFLGAMILTTYIFM